MTRQQQKLMTFVDFARELANLSMCKARSCGCVAFPSDFSAVLGIGYNGPSIGRPNDSCTHPRKEDKELARCGCIHAEATLCAKLGALSRPAILFSTTMPCPHCAGIIANSRKIVGVIWDRPYTTDEGLQVLLLAGIAYVHLSVLDNDELMSTWFACGDREWPPIKNP